MDESPLTGRTIEYQMTRADIRRLTRFIYFREKPLPAALSIAFRVLILVTGIVLAIKPDGNGWPDHSFAYLMIFVGGLLCLATIMLTVVGKAPPVAGRKMTLTDAGILSDQEEWQIMMGWRSFIRVARDRTTLYAFLSPLRAVILPERAFEDRAEMDAWYRVIEEAVVARRATDRAVPPAGPWSVTFVHSQQSVERALVWGLQASRKGRRWERLLLPAMMVFLYLRIAGIDVLKTVTGAIAAMVIGVIFYLLALLVKPGISRRLTRQILRTADGSHPETVGLTEEGLVSVSLNNWSVFRWGSIKRIEMVRDLICFLLPGGSVSYVPRAAFLDPSEADNFYAAAMALKNGKTPPSNLPVWPPRPGS